MPNAQGVLIHRRSRNLMIAFNKVLQIWRYEKDDEELHAGFLSSHYPSKQLMQGTCDGVGIRELDQFDLPVPEHLKRDFLPEVANARRDHEAAIDGFIREIAKEQDRQAEPGRHLKDE